MAGTGERAGAGRAFGGCQSGLCGGLLIGVFLAGGAGGILARLCGFVLALDCQLGQHAARFSGGLPGVLHGSRSYVLQDEFGQIAATHSVSAGLDYPSVGPEHAWLHDLGRAEYCACCDKDALAASRTLCLKEGIIPAVESAHAVAEAVRRAPLSPGQTFIVNLSGRGDKDIDIYRENIPELDR